MAGSIEGSRRVLDPIRVDLCLPRVPWSHFCCIECKNIVNNYFHLGQAIKSGKYGGTLALKGCARVHSWSQLVNFFFRPRDNGQTWIYSLVWGKSGIRPQRNHYLVPPTPDLSWWLKKIKIIVKSKLLWKYLCYQRYDLYKVWYLISEYDNEPQKMSWTPVHKQAHLGHKCTHTWQNWYICGTRHVHVC